MVAVVTGASGGMGLDMSCILASMGYDLVMVARNEEMLVKRAKQIYKKYGVKVTVYTMDLSVEENAYSLFEKTKDMPVEVLINNAGFGKYGAFDQVNLDEEIDLINVNVRALHILTKLFVKRFVEEDKGYILNVASIAGFISGPLFSSYYASKNYVLALTEAIHYELKKKGANVNITALCPGPVKTNFFAYAGFSKSLALFSMKSKNVASKAISGLFEGKAVIIPGVINKIAIFASRLVPRSLVNQLVYLLQKAKTK